MTLGRDEAHDHLFDPIGKACENLSATSIFRILHDRGDQLFADERFSDLFSNIGRRSIAPRIVGTVMVLQRLEGLSDYQAVERLQYDMRWKFAARLTMDDAAFVSTVRVYFRARLAGSKDPDRIFRFVKEVAEAAGLIGRKRVLDSTALYDAVSTQDTVTLIHDAIRRVLKELDSLTKGDLEGQLGRKGDYKDAGKPACNWDNREAREKLLQELAGDGNKVLGHLENKASTPSLEQAAELLATVLGQDIKQEDQGRWSIVRGVATDRVISPVDPETRHGHKTESRRFDGYKGHIAIDPDSEIITATDVTAGNVGDGKAVESLLAKELEKASKCETSSEKPAPIEVYGDASYGGAEVLETLESAGFEANVKVQPPAGRDGHFTSDDFTIDLEKKTVACPAGHVVRLRVMSSGERSASFGDHCEECPMRTQCTDSKRGRTMSIHRKYELISRYRTHQRNDDWKQKYRSTRPKVERKFAHLMRHRHGGRRARVRGCQRVGATSSCSRRRSTSVASRRCWRPQQQPKPLPWAHFGCHANRFSTASSQPLDQFSKTIRPLS